VKCEGEGLILEREAYGENGDKRFDPMLWIQKGDFPMTMDNRELLNTLVKAVELDTKLVRIDPKEVQYIDSFKVRVPDVPCFLVGARLTHVKGNVQLVYVTVDSEPVLAFTRPKTLDSTKSIQVYVQNFDRGKPASCGVEVDFRLLEPLQDAR